MGNKRGFRRIIIGILLACLSIFPAAAGAAAKASASVQMEVAPSHVANGQVFTVTITFVSTGDSIGALDAKISYDSNKMEYLYGSNAVFASGGNGGISDSGSENEFQKSYELTFRAKAEGSASFAVSSSEVVGYTSGQDLGAPNKKISIAIGGGSPGSDPAETPASSAPAPGEEEPIEMQADGKTVYVLRSLENVTLPEGYVAGMLTLGEEEVPCARGEKTGLLLVYTVDTSGQYAFYCYNAASGTLFPFVTVASSGSYVFLREGTEIPEGFEEVSIQINGAQVQAWRQTSGPQDFYLVYAMDEEGRAGYYMYDAGEGTLQRAWTETVEKPAEPEAAPTPAPQKPMGYLETVASQPLLFAVLAVFTAAVVVLLVLVIVQARKKKKHF